LAAGEKCTQGEGMIPNVQTNSPSPPTHAGLLPGDPDGRYRNPLHSTDALGSPDPLAPFFLPRCLKLSHFVSSLRREIFQCRKSRSPDTPGFSPGSLNFDLTRSAALTRIPPASAGGVSVST